MVKILHFADAHIDSAAQGKHDSITGLPIRVMDFLRSLDEIVDTAIKENVDMVLFAGDAYKDRNPTPTYQREWGKRMIRLSEAGIPTLLLVGNHDMSPGLGRANALSEFDTLNINYIKVIDKYKLLEPADLHDVPVQVLALPWVTRSKWAASMNIEGGSSEDVTLGLYNNLTKAINADIQSLDPSLPTIFLGHITIHGAKYRADSDAVLGKDITLQMGLVSRPEIDYVALGHIHKAQDLNEGSSPPVIYSGSIERVDFGEANDDKYYVIAELESGAPAKVDWRKLENIRKFVERKIVVTKSEEIPNTIFDALPPPEEIIDAMMKVTITYGQDLEEQIRTLDFKAYQDNALDFRLNTNPIYDIRVRLPDDRLGKDQSLSYLLDIFFRSKHVDEIEIEELTKIALDAISLDGDSVGET